MVFTEFYMEGVIAVVENTKLTLSITAVSSTQECLEAAMTTPNLMGVLCIEHQATRGSERFYKELIKTLDRIALSSERVVALSVMHRGRLIPNFVYKVPSKALTISICKFDKLNEEMIRLDGLAPIVVATHGIFKTTSKKYFEHSVESQMVQGRDSLIESFIYMLSDNPSEEVLSQHFKKHPELKKAYSLKTSDEFEEECLEAFKDSAFEIFCHMLIEKRDAG